MSAAKINYNVLEAERSGELLSDLQTQLEQQVSAGDEIDSLPHVVLRAVVQGNYDHARSEIDRYISMKSDLPEFSYRTEKYVDHCKDLVVAIKAKRNFPGLASLNMSKQQELLDHVIRHFEELKTFLKKIEQVYRDTKLEDIRSTVIVVKTCSYVVLAIFGVGLALDLVSGMGQSFGVALDGAINSLLDILLSVLF